MEPFWYREFRRASRRTNSQLTERMLWSLIAAGVGVLITAILTLNPCRGGCVPYWLSPAYCLDRFS
jgi:hypothetical protein